MNRLRNEEGMILITVILLLAIVTLLGVMAINTSTIDIQIFGNVKRASTAFSGAEAGTDVVVPVIERTIAAGVLDPDSIPDGTLDTTNLGNEITGGSNYDSDTAAGNPDITITSLGGVEVQVDVDRMYSYNLPGGAMEFASGYEGVGAAAAGGGIGVLYKVTSQGKK
jgi:Tfp pilus assembly protein PilX